jgi:hypothetical protein
MKNSECTVTFLLVNSGFDIQSRQLQSLKGTLTRDFRPLVFFIKQLRLGP